MKKVYFFHASIALISSSAFACPSQTLKISNVTVEEFNSGEVYSGNTAFSKSVTLAASFQDGKPFKLYLDDSLGEAMLATIALNPTYGVTQELSESDKKASVNNVNKLDGHPKNKAKFDYLHSLFQKLCEKDQKFLTYANKTRDECIKTYQRPEIEKLSNSQLADALGGYVSQSTKGRSLSWPIGPSNSQSSTCLLSPNPPVSASGAVTLKGAMNVRDKSCLLDDGKQINYTTFEIGTQKWCYSPDNIIAGFQKTAALGSATARGIPKIATEKCDDSAKAISNSVTKYCFLNLEATGIDFWGGMMGNTKPTAEAQSSKASNE